MWVGGLLRKCDRVWLSSHTATTLMAEKAVRDNFVAKSGFDCLGRRWRKANGMCWTLAGRIFITAPMRYSCAHARCLCWCGRPRARELGCMRWQASRYANPSRRSTRHPHPAGYLLERTVCRTRRRGQSPRRGYFGRE